MSFTIHTTPTPLPDAVRALNQALAVLREREVLLLTSGGSALALMEHVDPSLMGPHVCITVLDERWTREAADSNFTCLTTLPSWKGFLDAGATSIDPRPRAGDDLYATAARFDRALKHWHITHRHGTALAIMGIGTDGHTAGILPFPRDPDTFTALFMHRTTCVRGYTVAPEVSPHTQRMSATVTYLLRHVDHTIVYATGAAKRGALHALLDEQAAPHTVPACVLRSLRDVLLYTDQPLT